VVIIKKINILIFLFVLISSKPILSSQIFDYETENFIEIINNEILSVNKYNKKIIFRIINDNSPNAFINQNNELFISSGLIIHSPNYVSFLSVLAHEIGHLEKYHIQKRKNSIVTLKSINTLSNLGIMVGSLLTRNPEVMSTLVLNQISINNFYINFSQDQEREADQYSIDTLNKLNLPKESVKQLLRILEDQALQKGFSEEYQKFSTHPVFKERYQIINEKKNIENSKFDDNLEDKFKFLKAKFQAYTDNKSKTSLTKHHKIYYEAIKESQSGNLINSLKKLNILIKNFPNNKFLIETKADILFSYGYKKEAIKFYKNVLEFHPNNKYVRLKIFNNLDIEILSFGRKNELFNKNINLIFEFTNNTKLINNLFKLALNLKKVDWINYFKIINNKRLLDNETYIKQLNNLKRKTNDKNLIKLLNGIKK